MRVLQIVKMQEEACASCAFKPVLNVLAHACLTSPNAAAALLLLLLQIVKMQEDPTNIPEGETPRSLLMYAYDTNVDACKPGDKVTITGAWVWPCGLADSLTG
jgi:hypothetical protein